MTAAQMVYRLDANKLQEALLARVVHNDQLDEQALHAWATQVGATTDPALLKVLDYLRFDPEWLEQNNYSHHAGEWFVTVVASFLLPNPSLTNNRYRDSISVLQLVLPLAGWRESEIELLTSGGPIVELIAASQRTDFVAEFVTAAQQYGRWLSSSQVNELQAKLIQAAPYFEPGYPNAQEVLSAAERRYNVPSGGLTAGDKITYAYQDGLDLLGSAAKNEQGLFFIPG